VNTRSASLAFAVLAAIPLLVAWSTRSRLNTVLADVERRRAGHDEDRQKTDAIRARLYARSGIDAAAVEVLRARRDGKPPAAKLDHPFGVSYRGGRDLAAVTIAETSAGTFSVTSRGELLGDEDKSKASATARATVKVVGDEVEVANVTVE
jgi:hypothetical protein